MKKLSLTIIAFLVGCAFISTPSGGSVQGETICRWKVCGVSAGAASGGKAKLDMGASRNVVGWLMGLKSHAIRAASSGVPQGLSGQCVDEVINSRGGN